MSEMPFSHRCKSQETADKPINPVNDSSYRILAGNNKVSAAELSARAVQRLSVLGEMTTGIAHDFRNILAIIDSGLRLAENNLDDLRAASTFIAGAREGIARGLMLTSQLLAFAKQRESEARPADVNELLKALESFLRYSAGSEVRVVLQLSSNIPSCNIDPSQFNAAMLNLVINARDAMPNGGDVWISTAPWIFQSDVIPAPRAWQLRSSPRQRQWLRHVQRSA